MCKVVALSKMKNILQIIIKMQNKKYQRLGQKNKLIIQHITILQTTGIEANHIKGISQECPLCKKQFKTRKTINSHVLTQHNESNEDIKHNCAKCEFTTIRK